MMVRVNMTVKAMLKREKVLRGAGLDQANEHAEGHGVPRPCSQSSIL